MNRPSIRDQHMINLRLAGAKLRVIGDTFGVTRQRVEQILKKYGARKPQRPPRWKTRLMFQRMRQWLLDCGYRYCPRCKGVLCVDQFMPKVRECKPCNAARMRRLYATSEKHREYCRVWQEKQAEAGYFREYYRRPEVKKKQLKLHREYLDRLMADPVKHEALKAKWREQYQRRKRKAA